MTNSQPLAVLVICPLGLLVNNFMLENVQAKLDLPDMFSFLPCTFPSRIQSFHHIKVLSYHDQ